VRVVFFCPNLHRRSNHMKSNTRNLISIILFLIVILIIILISEWTPLNLILGPQYEKNRVSYTNSVLSQNLWSVSEYSNLVKVIDNSPNNKIKTSYKTGPGGLSKIEITLSKKGGVLLLVMKLPKQAVMAYDEDNNKMIPFDTNPLIFIRDNNLDGQPDDFIMEPGKPLDKSTLTSDGFVKIQNTEEYKSIIFQWNIGIGYSVKHFLQSSDL